MKDVICRFKLKNMSSPEFIKTPLKRLFVSKNGVQFFENKTIYLCRFLLQQVRNQELGIELMNLVNAKAVIMRQYEPHNMSPKIQ